MTLAAKLGLSVLILMGLIWTPLWAWIVTNARRSESYENVAPKAGRLRKSLLPIALIALGAAFLASLPFLPYDYVRSGTLGSPEITVEVVGRQWAWEIHPREIPVGVPVEFLVRAADVNHGFGLYDPDGRLVAQVQAMPGYTNRLIYTFKRPGTYRVRCLEFCGVVHHAMATIITVQADKR